MPTVFCFSIFSGSLPFLCHLQEVPQLIELHGKLNVQNHLPVSQREKKKSKKVPEGNHGVENKRKTQTRGDRGDTERWE